MLAPPPCSLLTGAATAQVKLPETLTWTAYDVGSGGYNQAVAIGNALKNKYQVNLRVLPGKNDVSRNIPLRDGKVPFSANGVGGSYLAQEGVYEFGARDWGPQAVRALLLNNSDALLTIVTAKDANIHTAADFKGKRVAWVVGAPSLNQNITALLAFASLTWNDVTKVEFGGFGAGHGGGRQQPGRRRVLLDHLRPGLQDRVVAARHCLSDVPAWRQGRLGARAQDRAVLRAGLRHRRRRAVAARHKAEAATYPYPVLMTMKGTDAELVYNMTKAMVELFDDYKDGAPGNKGWDIKRQIFAWAIPMHEGAIRYFKEKGLWTAEHQKHNDELVKRQDTLAAAWAAYKARRRRRQGVQGGLDEGARRGADQSRHGAGVTSW